MAPVRTRDMEMYSPIHQDIYDALRRQQRQQDGPVAGRTRSRTKVIPTNTTTTTRHATSGAITKPRTSTRLLVQAQNKLARTRAQLKHHLTTSPQFRNAEGILNDFAYDKIAQLVTTNAPAPYPATWATEKKMRRRLHPRQDASPLATVMRNWSAEELDEEFALLPGENLDEGGEGDDEEWWARMDVEEGLLMEGRCLRDLEDGLRAKGVWRRVRCVVDKEMEE
jgi:hypothetical protein